MEKDAKAVGQKRVSLKDIAARAGTSHVTVSLALRDHPKISAQTRQKVQRLAQQMGYRPDPMLKALSEYRKQSGKVRYQATLGWINNFPVHAYTERHLAFRMYQEAAIERAQQLGYQVEVFSPYADGISMPKLRRMLIARGISGLLVAPHSQTNVDWGFDVSGFSAVIFGFSLNSPKLHVVTNNQVRSSAIAVEQLKALGYSRIGLAISQTHHERTAHNFLSGFLGATMENLADKVRSFCIFNAHFDRKAWETWKAAYRPDAVIVGDADIAEEIRNTGVKIPEALAVAILANIESATYWAGIDQNDRRIGHVATDTLVGLLHRNETGVPDLPLRILVESTWKDGKSVIPKRKRRAAARG